MKIEYFGIFWTVISKFLLNWKYLNYVNLLVEGDGIWKLILAKKEKWVEKQNVSRLEPPHNFGFLALDFILWDSFQNRHTKIHSNCQANRSVEAVQNKSFINLSHSNPTVAASLPYNSNYKTCDDLRAPLVTVMGG